MRAPVPLVAMTVLAALTRGQDPGERRPSFPAGVERVTVDVVVVDREGAPVRGLRAEDFTLEEDGRPQALAAFEAVDRPPAAAARTDAGPSLPPRVSSNRGGVVPRRPGLRDRLRRPAPRHGRGPACTGGGGGLPGGPFCRWRPGEPRDHQRRRVVARAAAGGRGRSPIHPAAAPGPRARGRFDEGGHDGLRGPSDRPRPRPARHRLRDASLEGRRDRHPLSSRGRHRG